MNDPKKNGISNDNNSGIVKRTKRSESHCVMRTHVRTRVAPTLGAQKKRQ